MAKPKGATSFETITVEALIARLGGRKDVGVKVSKGWLRSIDEIFGGAPSEAEEADEDTGAKSGGVVIVED